MAEISFVCIQEEQLNHEVRRTRVAPRPAMPRHTAPSTAIQAPAPKKLTRDELCERSAKELCWHCNEPWSRGHRYKKGRLLMIEPLEDEDNETSEESLEPKEEAMEEESQPANYAVHALADYSNPQMMKVGGLLKHQLITVLIDTGSTNNFLNSKVAARLVLQIEVEPPTHNRPYCCPHLQKAEAERILSQEWTMLPKVFPVDDLRSTANDPKKIKLLQWQYGICDTIAY
ncbi:hypothetical protein B296_00027776 [Ensete ventricosum]|uniref:Uncharacterized protein n=1 Tax=Ensete ventricosum TaxID=4639 RepID=A0A426YIW0_ENSVE|nr:hypothetical protein B296_00027776 [Ensete ventricosum]